MVCDHSLCPFGILGVNNHVLLFAVSISHQIYCNNVHCFLIHNSNLEDNKALLCSFSRKHSSWNCLSPWFALLCVISWTCRANVSLELPSSLMGQSLRILKPLPFTSVCFFIVLTKWSWLLTKDSGEKLFDKTHV